MLMSTPLKSDQSDTAHKSTEMEGLKVEGVKWVQHWQVRDYFPQYIFGHRFEVEIRIYIYNYWLILVINFLCI
jgi:hypothetical protein